MPSFVQRHAADVIGKLSGFDRLRARGTLRFLSTVGGMGSFMSQTGRLLKNFGAWVKEVTDQVKASTLQIAERAGRPVQYLASSAANKEQVALEIARRDGIKRDLIAVLSCVESCQSFEVCHNRETKYLELRYVPRKCLHYYFYCLRIKHRINRNSIKMYDKQGSVLRVETTINDPRDMKAFRPKEGDEDGPKAWRYLRKGVADLHRRAEISQAANERYLQSLAAVDETTPLAALAKEVCRPIRWKGQPVRALNPLSSADAALLEAVHRGEFVVHGFRNRDLRALLYPSAAADLTETRRRASAITRQLRMLRAHGLIQKVPHTHRYMINPQGQKIITAFLAARQANTAQLMNAA